METITRDTLGIRCILDSRPIDISRNSPPAPLFLRSIDKQSMVFLVLDVSIKRLTSLYHSDTINLTDEPIPMHVGVLSRFGAFSDN